MCKAFENLRDRIEAKEFQSYSEARQEISKNLITGNITNNEHAELRCILNSIYNN